jgi:hypothetical protein
MPVCTTTTTTHTIITTQKWVTTRPLLANAETRLRPSPYAPADLVSRHRGTFGYALEGPEGKFEYRRVSPNRVSLSVGHVY